MFSHKKHHPHGFPRKSRGSSHMAPRINVRPPHPHQQPRHSGSTKTYSFGQNSTGPTTPRAPCQICGKPNHQALDCYHRMDYTYQGRHPLQQLAAMIAENNTLVEDDWYADSGANAHITADLEKLSL
jgi:hypothetical protein